MSRRYAGKAEAQRRRWADPVYRERWIVGAKARWATPEHRAKMGEAGFMPVTAEDHRRHPERYSRLGIPTGMNRAEAEKLWAEAERQADMALKGLEASGIIPIDVLPNSDEAMAKAALHQAALLALGPTSKRTKLQAINIVLTYTKAKPAERRAIIRANNPADEWMRSVALAVLAANRA